MTKTMNLKDLLKKDKEEGLKPIEFRGYLSTKDNEIVIGNCIDPINWNNIVLLKKGHYDIMFAFDVGDEENGCVYIGHWNDGVVK